MQQYVQRAYEVWWMDLVYLFECENWRRDPFARWDSWKAVWFCQMNSLYHNIPKSYYQDRWFQIDYCNQKRLWWTAFYWPTRKINWKACYLAVQNRFLITD